MSSSLADRLRQPEYTGENRCVPCTAVNVAIALVLAAAVGVLSTLAAVAVLAVSLAAIALRGYLVPGTPTLTKRYLPDSVLAKFDKAPAPGARPTAQSTPDPAAAGSAPDAAGDATVDTESEGDADAGSGAFVDPEEALVGADAVEPCEGVDDLCLTDWFAEAWQTEATRLRDDREAQRATVEDFFGGTDNLLFYEDDDDGRFHAYDGNDELHVWVSRGALLSDLAAHEVLGDDDWRDIPVEQRLGIGRALRTFLPACPVCGGEVGTTEDTVESCCRSWDVVAVRCFDCGEHFLEIDPQTMGVVENYGASVGSAGGPEGVGGGFTR